MIYWIIINIDFGICIQLKIKSNEKILKRIQA